MTDLSKVFRTAPPHGASAEEAYIPPKMLITLANQLRGVAFKLRIAGVLHVEKDTTQAWPVGGFIDVSAAQVKKLAGEWDQFSGRRKALSGDTAVVLVSRLGDCLFIG